MKRWYEEMYDNRAVECDKDLKEWYEKLFANSRRESDKGPLIKGTEGEVDFIESELGFDRRVATLDIGCGTGRHAVASAKRGYQVTAVDLSESQLARARVKAAAAHADVQFVKADARYLDYSDQFNAVIMLNSAFGLMETDELNLTFQRTRLVPSDNEACLYLLR